MQITLKGLPLAYNKDMQEDKEGLFDALHTYLQCLQMLAFALPELSVNRDHAARQAALGYSNATELADYMVSKGIPFRDAHHLTGELVLLAQQQGVALEQLRLAEFQQVCDRITDDVYTSLALNYGLQQRKPYGGTAPTAVKSANNKAQ